MSRMTIRYSYTIDVATAMHIKRLAGIWGVSQAEVTRRSVQRAAQAEAAVTLSPADVVMHYRNNAPPRSAEEIRAVVESLRQSRCDEDAKRARGA